MRDAAPSRCMPSFTAGSSALLGLLSLLAVLCFLFPQWLTFGEFRKVYSEQFARTLFTSLVNHDFLTFAVTGVDGG